MDRSKQQTKRGPKVKPLPPPGDFIVLGSKAQKPSADLLEIKLGSAGSKASSRDSPGILPVTPLGGGGPLSKKPKLSIAVGSSGRSHGITWESVAIEVEPSSLVQQITAAEDRGDDEKAEKVLCGCVKLLRATRSKPETSLFVGLMYLAKSKPGLFCSNLVTEAFCSLLRRDANVSTFKAKANPMIMALSANILLAAYQEEENWPDAFVKVYLDDALGERLWVDQDDCKGFVDNIVATFNTKMPPKGLLPPELGFKPDVAASPPSTSGATEQDDEMGDANVLSADAAKERLPADLAVFPRYMRSSEAIEQFVVDVIREQLNRRQPMDNVSRNFLRVLSTTSGLDEVRLLVAQKLEMWIQNPKLTRYAQELLLAVCLNCHEHHKQDIDVIGHLIKIRMKTKPLVHHYLLCIRELLGQHPENLTTVLKHTVYNELSTSRNPNNMGLIGVIFQHSQEQAAKVLAETFQDVLNNREDYLRAIRGLYREIVRSLRQDMNFTSFCLGLMTERKEPNFKDMDASIRDRLFLAVADLITLSIFLAVTPAVREVALSRVERKDVGPLRAYQKQVAEIQRDAIWWLHNAALRVFKPAKSEYMHCLQKVLLMEQPEHYYNKDNWPQESERMLLLRLASEVPLLEDTLLWLLLIGLSKDHPLNPNEALELVDQLVKRVALLHCNDFQVLDVQRVDLINILFNLCAYHYPENISLPSNYQPPSLAIASLYWKAWILLLIVTAHNPLTFGFLAWENYPTLRCFMEMCITNHFAFPPPTIVSGEKADEIRLKELQMCQLEKQDILEFENHLASASTKVVITETNSLLLTQLTTMDPSGACRRPPTHVLEQLKSLNSSLKLGHLLCRTRNPDFLLDIIQRQGASQSMPWLANLVESSEGSFGTLPVQCLCEFLLNEQLDAVSASPLLGLGGYKDDAKADKARRKEKQRKQRRLLMHLQQVLCNRSSQPQQQSIEILDYFLRRLSSSQTISRRQALRSLVLVLTPLKIHESADVEDDDDDDDDDDDEDESAAAVAAGKSHIENEDKNAWLLRHLPSLPDFETVRYQTSLAIRQAVQVENDPVTMLGYIHFLANYALDEQLQDLADLTLDVAHVIVQRTTIINYLLPFGAQSTCDSDLLLAFLIIFIKYLRKAREPSKEAYSWSESQDQILVQWSTGEAATMHVLVVHAMIVLLTYGPPKESALFNELLEVWFPSRVDPPQAYLVDTSEEALLYPDWLKLRMIRSSVEVLVDASLKDLEPAQLVLFIQSFGIPIQSISKLLRALDAAVEYDSYTVESVVVDKVYMAHLVEVQQQRGAKYGLQFAAFLGLVANATADGSSSVAGAADEAKTKSSSPSALDGVTSLLASIQTPPTLGVRSAAAAAAAAAVPQMLDDRDIPAAMAKLFGLDTSRQVLSSLERDNLLRSLQKLLANEARLQTLDKSCSRQLVHFMLNVLDSPDAACFVSALVTQYAASCPLFRLLLTSCGKQGVISNPLASNLQVICQKIMVMWSASGRPNTPIIHVIKPMVADVNTAAITDKSVAAATAAITIKGRAAGDLDYDSIVRAIERAASKDSSRVEEVVHSLVRKALSRSSTDSLISAFTAILIGDPRSSTALQQRPMCEYNSLLVDWLDLLEPEVIGTNRLLQQKLLFHKRPKVHGDGSSKQQQEGSDSIYRTCRPYLLATLIHQANWETLRRCIGLLLVEQSDEYDPAIVLDFLFACVHIPKIWQGRDKHLPKHCRQEDVLRLTEAQILSMAHYVMLEAAGERVPVSGERAWSIVESRMPLLLRCCCLQRQLALKSLVKHLEAIVDDVGYQQIPGLPDAARILLLHMYLQIPSLIKHVRNKEHVIAHSSLVVNTPSQLDPMSHTLLTALCVINGDACNKEKLQEVEQACRKLAATHPVLLLKQLPMIAAALQGCNSMELVKNNVARQRTAFFSRVLGQLHLLQPLLFRTEHAASLDVIFESYFDFIQNVLEDHRLHHGEFSAMVSRFFHLMLSFVNADAPRAIRCIQMHAPGLGNMSESLPNNAVVRSVLSILSLPKPPPQPQLQALAEERTTSVDDREPFGVLSFTPPQIPPKWTPAQLTMMAARLANKDRVDDIASALADLSNMSLRKVEMLEHFTDEIKRLVSHRAESCRSPAQKLMMKYLNYKPSASGEFLDAFLGCLESDSYDVVISTLERLAEFVVLCQDHARILLQRVFEINTTRHINTMPYICEVIAFLNVQEGI